MNAYEVIKFKNNDIEIDVSVSPNEETVWLTLEQISLLFDRDRSVIRKHINNIYKEGELIERSTCAKNAQVQIEGKRKVKRIYYFYNLDVIISVGYRVKSRNGVIFRKWANKILKDYLIKGYCLSNRVCVSNENYLTLFDKVLSLDKEVNKLKREISKIKPNSKIFYKGQYFESQLFITEILDKYVNNRLIIIDPYFDAVALNIFKTKKNIKCKIITSSKSKLNDALLNSFSNEYFPIAKRINDEFHDRFLIIDGKTIFHIGTSLNYLGNKTFILTEIEDEYWCKEFLEKVNRI